jgi:GxxExxY protein
MAADNPRMAADEINRVTEKIIGAAHRVSNTLGDGFLEKLYENAMVVELRKAGLQVEQQRPVQVRYDGEIIGDYVADILVEGKVVVELKAVTFLDRIHRSQCVNYLRATGLPICLLLNFGQRRLEVRRIVYRLAFPS